MTLIILTMVWKYRLYFYNYKYYLICNNFKTKILRFDHKVLGFQPLIVSKQNKNNSAMKSKHKGNFTSLYLSFKNLPLALIFYKTFKSTFHYFIPLVKV